MRVRSTALMLRPVLLCCWVMLSASELAAVCSVQLDSKRLNTEAQILLESFIYILDYVHSNADMSSGGSNTTFRHNYKYTFHSRLQSGTNSMEVSVDVVQLYTRPRLDLISMHCLFRRISLSWKVCKHLADSFAIKQRSQQTIRSIAPHTCQLLVPDKTTIIKYLYLQSQKMVVSIKSIFRSLIRVEVLVAVVSGYKTQIYGGFDSCFCENTWCPERYPQSFGNYFSKGQFEISMIVCFAQVQWNFIAKF